MTFREELQELSRRRAENPRLAEDLRLLCLDAASAGQTSVMLKRNPAYDNKFPVRTLYASASELEAVCRELGLDLTFRDPLTTPCQYDKLVISWEA